MHRFLVMIKGVLKLFFLCFVVSILSSGSAFASHLMGGDVIYKCLGNNQFQITLTIFQDCLNGSSQAIAEDDPAYYAIYTQGANPSLIQEGPVPSNVTRIIPPGFSNSCITNYPNTCLREQIFIFTVTLPPTNVGYYIVYQRCCRNAVIGNLVNPGNVGVTYMAEIPPYASGECPNNSAVFKSLPPQIICVNNPFSYDFSATDPDGDSLSYELCNAYPGGSPNNSRPTGNQILPPPYSSVAYMPPYSATQPIPGVPPITINPVTGLMRGVPSQTGRFIVSVCAHEWRNGQVINTLRRDVQFVITDCSKNVIAGIPELPSDPNTYTINCKGYTVHFINTSQGGDTYYWEFGVPGATSTQFEPTFTYPDTGIYSVKLILNRGTTCQDSISRLVKIYPFFKAGFSYSGKLCAGEPIHFFDTSLVSFPPVISRDWDFGDGSPHSTLQNPVHVYTPPGGSKIITFVVQTALGCIDTARVEIPIDYLSVFAGNDTIIVKGYPFQLHGSGAQSYNWSPSDYLTNPNVADPSATFPDTGNYTYVLTGTTKQGCMAKDTINILVVNEGSLFVPTAFSPNGDGINDVLRPSIIGYTQIDAFRIFNRYGQLVYASARNMNPGWDGTLHGKLCDMGTYFWNITATNFLGEKVTKKGDVTLVR